MLDLKSLIPWKKRNEIPAHHYHADEKGNVLSHSDNGNAIENFRKGLQSLFDDFLTAVTGHRDTDFLPAPNGRSLSATGPQTGWSFALPQVDVSDGEKELIVSAELPGVSEKDVDITLSGDVLTIHGEKKYDHEEKEGNRYYVERRYGSFSRSIRLPFDADEVDVKARFDNGVLKITIPKPENIKSGVRHITVTRH